MGRFLRRLVDGFAIVALVALLGSIVVRAGWVDAVFRPPWKTAKIVAMSVSLALAAVTPLGWIAVVVVSGAMLLEPRIRGGDDL